MTSNSSGVASYSLRRCVSAPAANQMMQRRTNSVRPVGRVSQADSLAQQLQRRLIERCAVPLRQAADVLRKGVVLASNRQLIHVANLR